MSALALPRTVVDLIEEYDAKCDGLAAEIERFNDSASRLEMMGTVSGAYAGNVFRTRPSVCERSLKANLLKSGWRAIYQRLQVERIASAEDKRKFERGFEDPPELTLENARATFEDYFTNARWHILRGLAEVFTQLDPAYKSHSKVRIGVKGLPKRVILTNFGDYSGTYGRDRLRDMVNALAAMCGQPMMEHEEFQAISDAHRANKDAVLGPRGIRVRKFANGNAHVFFTPETLKVINLGLAEFYGEVLPDVDEDGASHKPGTALAKDLQFYWTPPAVIDRALEEAGIPHRNDYAFGAEPKAFRALEPSCGDGRILDALAARGCRSFGIEVHPGRAEQARAKGHKVLTANFLECPPEPIFDKVVMNPPFYGRHYAKHVRHALRWLKPGGMLVTILPASAHYDHGELEGRWTDLPVASFAAAGTNIPTGLMRMFAPAQAQDRAA